VVRAAVEDAAMILEGMNMAVAVSDPVGWMDCGAVPDSDGADVIWAEVLATVLDVVVEVPTKAAVPLVRASDVVGNVGAAVVRDEVVAPEMAVPLTPAVEVIRPIEIPVLVGSTVPETVVLPALLPTSVDVGKTPVLEEVIVGVVVGRSRVGDPRILDKLAPRPVESLVAVLVGEDDGVLVTPVLAPVKPSSERIDDNALGSVVEDDAVVNGSVTLGAAVVVGAVEEPVKPRTDDKRFGSEVVVGVASVDDETPVAGPVNPELTAPDVEVGLDRPRRLVTPERRFGGAEDDDPTEVSVAVGVGCRGVAGADPVGAAFGSKSEETKGSSPPSEEVVGVEPASTIVVC